MELVDYSLLPSFKVQFQARLTSRRFLIFPQLKLEVWGKECKKIDSI